MDGLPDLFGGVENLRVAVAAGRVELIKLPLDKDFGTNYSKSGSTVVVASSEDALLLVSIFTADTTFNWKGNYVDDCPHYRVRIRFCQRTSHASVDLSFGVRSLLVVRSDTNAGVMAQTRDVERVRTVVSRYFPEVFGGNSK
jgi:hypothetical protein